MKNLLFLILAILLLSACSPTPRPIDYNSDLCHYCKMTIVDRQHAAEAVTKKGKVYTFDAIECLTGYLGNKDEADFAFLLVNDFSQPESLIGASNATYLISKAIPSPMGAYLSAFADADEAEKTKAAKGGDIYSWENLKNQLATTR